MFTMQFNIQEILVMKMELEIKLVTGETEKYYRSYESILKGNLDYNHPDYQRVWNNITGGERGHKCPALM